MNVFFIFLGSLNDVLDRSLHAIQSAESPEQTTVDNDSIDSSSIDFLPDADKEKDIFRTKVHYISLSMF